MDKMNAGYHILEEEIYEVGDVEFYGVAIGYKAGVPSEWVTWYFTQSESGISYFWGNYYVDWASAYKDYHERLAREYARMEG